MVTIKRHRKRHGFVGSIRVENGQSSCDYQVKVSQHPHFDDLLSLTEGDWSGFSIEITRGTRRRREIVIRRQGDEESGLNYYEELDGSTITMVAQQFLLHAAKVGIDALISLRRETLRGAILAGTNLTLPNHVTLTVPLPREAALQTAAAGSAFSKYLLAPDADWR
ncbi:MAG: hypothetical protein Q7S64_01270 [bacterium]|nr:hypothetical protein [bacterium]